MQHDSTFPEEPKIRNAKLNNAEITKCVKLIDSKDIVEDAELIYRFNNVTVQIHTFVDIKNNVL